jgi:hypothetical protein
MRFYTTVALSARKALTPEGFLVCYDVPVARVGELVYYADELVPSSGENPLQFADDGSLRVQRSPDQVFRPETLASALGKPLVNEHPDDNVTPDDWSKLAIGIILNPRRGEGAESDLFLVDIMVMTAAGIEAVNDGKRELSFGYDAHYRVLGKGRAEQFNIIINHVALVEQGRCGPRCAIRDAAPQRQEPAMPGNNKGGSLRERLMKAFRTRDEAGMQAVADELGGDDAPAPGTGSDKHTHVHVHLDGDPDASDAPADGEPVAATMARLDKIEAEVEAIKVVVEKLTAAKRSTRTGDTAGGPASSNAHRRRFDFNRAMAERYGRPTRLD